MRKVSILTTCYNAEKTISNSLKSSLNQNFEDYEIVVVDLPDCLGNLQMVNLLSCIVSTIFF